MEIAARKTEQRKLIAEIKAKAETLALANPSPGLAIAVIKQGYSVVMEGFGLANVEHEVPVTPKTVFKIGSLTKQFTAAAILKLRDTGQLDLDEPISKFLNDLPFYISNITIRQLLNHTSGIVNYTELGDKFRAIEREDIDHSQMIDLLSSESLNFEPGSTSQYSNSGYYLLGMIIEKVSKKSYAEFLEEVIFDPLGMHNTSYCSDDKIIKNRSSGYNAEKRTQGFEGLAHAEYISMNLPFAAGALCSTIEDLNIWLEALTRGKALTPESFQEMTTPAILNDGAEAIYGFGLLLPIVDGKKKLIHAGGVPGFFSILSHYPEQKLTVIILSNSNSGNIWEMEEVLGDMAGGLDLSA